MHKASIVFLAFALFGSDPAELSAQGTTLQSGPLVDHPIAHPASGRSAGNWRTSVGAWGEHFADHTLRLRGFNEIYEFKHGANNGIDRIAVKRGLDGKIYDIKFVEVKATRSPKPMPGQTKYGGRQMSRKWLSENLKMMRRSGAPELRKLALEIGRFERAAKIPLESMGEVLHINTKTGKVTGYAALGRTMKFRQSMERMLKTVQSRASSKTARDWATRTLSEFDQIRASRMSDYLGQTASQQSKRSLVSNSSRHIRSVESARFVLLRESRSKMVTTILKRSAGRVAVFIAVAIDAKEICDVEYAYRTGTISVRQRNIRLASTVGGLGGAFAGASGGAVAGAWIGGFGGPIAWLTVPAGGLVGGVIGGIGGYFGGSAVAGYGATGWYDSIDASVRDRFELSWINDNEVAR